MTIYVVCKWVNVDNEYDQLVVGMITTDRAKAEAFASDPVNTELVRPMAWNIKEVADGEERPDL